MKAAAIATDPKKPNANNFSDDDFPKEDAVYWTDATLSGGTAFSALAPKLWWLRISDYFTPLYKYSMFGNDGKPTLDDIRQGSIGNCWFMAAASAIAEKPSRMELAFGGIEKGNEMFNNQLGFFDL